MVKSSIVLAVSGLALLCAAASALAADMKAGEAEFNKVCHQCHEVMDWKGKSDAELRSMIAAVSSGKKKHPKKLDLSQDQIADVAAWASNANGSGS